jgi:hypothetical protein
MSEQYIQVVLHLVQGKSDMESKLSVLEKQVNNIQEVIIFGASNALDKLKLST